MFFDTFTLVMMIGLIVLTSGATIITFYLKVRNTPTDKDKEDD